MPIFSKGFSIKKITLSTFIIFTLCLSYALFSINHIESDVALIKESDLKNGQEFLTLDQQKKELEIVLQSIQLGYAGWDFLTNYQKNTFKTHLVSDIEPRNIDIESFCKKIASHLKIFPDNHLIVQKYLGFSCLVHIKKNIPILKIYDFAPYSSDRWNHFLETVQETLMEKTENFILDLRDNGGGDSRMGDRIVEMIIGKPQVFLKNPPFNEIINSSSERFFKNALKIKEFQYGSFDAPQIQKSVPLKHYNQPEKIWVLINNGCGSSCELTVLKLRNHPHVSLVGQNTGGAYEYGNAGAVILPYSKLILRLPR
jgi:hypothetical protein